jgi:putative transposase
LNVRDFWQYQKGDSNSFSFARASFGRVVYTTNVIESLNFSLRKIIKGRSAFPNDDSVYRLIYLGLEQISRKWTMPIRNWKAALQQFAILYEDRLPLEALGITKV